mgnify:CR=1 FL=1
MQIILTNRSFGLALPGVQPHCPAPKLRYALETAVAELRAMIAANPDARAFDGDYSLEAALQIVVENKGTTKAHIGNQGMGSITIAPGEKLLLSARGAYAATIETSDDGTGHPETHDYSRNDAAEFWAEGNAPAQLEAWIAWPAKASA